MPAVSGNNNQPMRLRDLRDSTLPRDKSEVRAPTRRPKFEDSLKHEKAGEVVGEFPSKFDKGLSKQTLRRSALQVATERQKPRQAVAALMAREGISDQFLPLGQHGERKSAAHGNRLCQRAVALDGNQNGRRFRRERKDRGGGAAQALFSITGADDAYRGGHVRHDFGKDLLRNRRVGAFPKVQAN